jgi:hypothetical protein
MMSLAVNNAALILRAYPGRAASKHELVLVEMKRTFW